MIYLHARIVEDRGRLPTDSIFGVYEYDAILDSLRQAGFVVLSKQRPAATPSDVFAAHVTQQVDSLLDLGVPPTAISVVGFSKGGWIAILASSRLQNPAISFVFLGACGPWSNEPDDLHVAGRLLSLYERSDSLGVSCAPMLARRSPGSVAREIELNVGRGHGTFFQPRADWLTPVTAWAQGREP
jgi:dienelactone hydrolase